MDPFNRSFDPLNGSLGPSIDASFDSPMPHDPIPSGDFPADPMPTLSGAVDDVTEPFDVGSDLFDQNPGLNKPGRLDGEMIEEVGPRLGFLEREEQAIFGCEPVEIETFGPMPEKHESALEVGDVSKQSKLTVRTLVKMETGLDLDELPEEDVVEKGSEPSPSSRTDELLDELEDSIEKMELPKTKPAETISVEQNDLGIMGVSSPDLKITDKPERTYERRFKPKLWRPRRYSGLRKSQLSKSKKKSEKGLKDEDKTKVRECPRKEETISLAECETCDFWDGEYCTWEPDLEDGATHEME
jgi:hypothetical protein